MDGIENAQRSYDRQEPDYNDKPEQEYCTDANDLTEGEIRDFVDLWLNDETANDEASLEFMTIQAWHQNYQLPYDLRKWADKWTRQAAFEAQLPPNLKRQASIN